METLYLERAREVDKHKELLERKLNVKLHRTGRKLTVEGTPFNEYEANFVFEAINFGFPVDTALMLKEEDITFKRIKVKDFTRRKDLTTVRSRVIGTQGRTKRTIETIANCHMCIQGNEVGLIGAANEIEYALTALTNLIRGSKQANVYKFLERVNTQKKKYKE